jgi:hypothetical protein
LDAGVAAAREIISSRNAAREVRPNLERAVRFLVDYAELSAVDDLQPLLSDSSLWLRQFAVARQVGIPATPVEPPPPAVDVRVSDLVLLALLQVTGQDPAEYGFVDLQRDSDEHFATGRFATEEARQTAIRRWKSWQATHLRPHSTQPLDASEGELL